MTPSSKANYPIVVLLAGATSTFSRLVLHEPLWQSVAKKSLDKTPCYFVTSALAIMNAIKLLSKVVPWLVGMKILTKNGEI